MMCSSGAEIGVFDALGDVLTSKDAQKNFLIQVIRLPKKKNKLLFLFLLLLLLFMSGDIELNPGANKTNSSCKFLSATGI